MAMILDADVMIRGEKGAFDLKTWMSARSEDRFEIAAITVAELWHGMERAVGDHRARRERFLQSLLTALPRSNGLATRQQRGHFQQTSFFPSKRADHH